MASFEEDPKEVARIERKSPDVETGLRQFLNIDGPKGVTKKYRDNFDLIFKGADCALCGHRFLKEEMREATIHHGKEVIEGMLCEDCFGGP